MDILIKSRNGKPTEEERGYIESKLHKLGRYLEDIGSVHVDLAHAQQRGAGEIHIVQATLTAERGVIVRAEERDPDFRSAVDSLHDSLQRQLTRYKDRNYRRGRVRGANGDTPLPVAPENVSRNGAANASAPQVVKTKQFVYKPMHGDEAIEQMELLGHDFFIFTDADTNQVNVVYRRKDGHYGLIEQGSD